MKLVVLSFEDKTFSIPVDSVQLLNKEMEKAPTKIKFNGDILPVLQHPIIEQSVAEIMQHDADETIQALSAQVDTLQKKLDKITSLITNVTSQLDSD